MSVQDGFERRAEIHLAGPAIEATVRLANGSSFVGKGADATIQLPDSALEDRHLELDWDGAELWLIYLGKGARPLVNGQLAAEANLHSGDKVEIGEHVLNVRILRRARPAGVAADASATPEVLPATEAPPAAPAEQVPARPPDPNEQVLLEYTVHKLREEPRKAMIVGAGLLLFFVLLWFWVIPGQVMLMFLTMAILVGTVGAFIFPLHYRLTEAGVQINGFPVRDRKRWDRFGSYVEYPDAVQLLLPQASIRGRVLKGSLIYYGQHKDEVLAVVKARIPKGMVAAPPKSKRAKGLPK